MINTPKTTKRRKRIQIDLGDIISIPQSDKGTTLACVIGFWPKLDAVMTIAIFVQQFSIEESSIENSLKIVSEEFEKRNFISVLSTTTGTAGLGEWPKIGNIKIINYDDLLPDQPYRTGSLVGSSHHSAPLVEGLVEAFRCLSDWDALMPGRPGVLKNMLYSSSN